METFTLCHFESTVHSKLSKNTNQNKIDKTYYFSIPNNRTDPNKRAGREFQ